MKHDFKETTDGERRGSLARAGRVWSAASALAWGLALGALPVGAHPGHGLADGGIAHAVTSPYHLSVLIGVAVALGLGLALGARLVRRQRVRRLMNLSAGCALLAAAVIWLR